MDRSFAGRLGIGSLTRPAGRSANPVKRAKPRAGGVRPRTAGRATGLRHAVAHALTGAWALIRSHRRLRIAVIALVIALPLLGGGWLLLRQSPLVSVEHVRISGVHGAETSAIEAALSNAAKRMSTLDVNSAQLRAAVANYPVVGDLQVHASFPHGLSIRVIEQPPVAALTVGGVKTAVAADGVVLGPARVSSALPTLSSAVQLSPGEHVREATLLDDLTVLGAAPASLAKQVQRAYAGSKGLTLLMRSGLAVYFGDASLPHAKWLSLARVLADSSSAGASYIDVRLPERPAAGFPPGAAPASASGAGAEGATISPTNSESAQSLAEGLSSAAGGGANEPQSGAGEPQASSGEAGSTGEAESSSQSESSGESTPGASGSEATEASG